MLIFGLLGLLYVDVADLGEGAKQLVRWCLWLPPVLIPAGFGLSSRPLGPRDPTV